jgi:hypothetical protein
MPSEAHFLECFLSAGQKFWIIFIMSVCWQYLHNKLNSAQGVRKIEIHHHSLEEHPKWVTLPSLVAKCCKIRKIWEYIEKLSCEFYMRFIRRGKSYHLGRKLRQTLLIIDYWYSCSHSLKTRQFTTAEHEYVDMPLPLPPFPNYRSCHACPCSKREEVYSNLRLPHVNLNVLPPKGFPYYISSR